VVDLLVDGVRRRFDVTTVADRRHVDSPLGHRSFVEVERFPDPTAATAPGSLLAPMPGTVVRVQVAVGDRVRAGETVLAVEAMKMEHAITAPADGVVVTLPVATGAQVDTGDVLAVIEDEGGDGDG
jgi:propionyl-CoA carboxylase alpha chain